VLDGREELARLSAIAGETGKTADIFFRVKPGVEAHTHSFVQTGQIDSKFGVAYETGEAFSVIEAASKRPMSA
jgi:diaminopimelate decarboxylase